MRSLQYLFACLVFIGAPAVLGCSAPGAPAATCRVSGDCRRGETCVAGRCSRSADAGPGGPSDAAPSDSPMRMDGDGDGIDDSTEGRATDRDTDGDGTPDYLDPDSDADGLSDRDEGAEDVDGDTIPDYIDPRNDSPITPITLTAISTPFNNPIGIDYHEPTNSVVISANYSGGTPINFERIEVDGTHSPFSMVMGLTDEVKIATVRSGNLLGFITGDLYVGNGIDGQIARISADGMTVTSPWVDLPGASNGLMRGGLYVDRTSVTGGELIVVTTIGQCFRVTSAGVATLIAAAPADTHLEGVMVIPNVPARYGPLAGRILAGAEAAHLLYSFGLDGSIETHNVGVDIEDIEIIPIRENFFGVNFGSSRLLGAPADQFAAFAGDILLTQETHAGSSGLFLLRWDGTMLRAEEFPLSATSAPSMQWEHVTFAPAGIVEIPPLI